MCGSMPKIIYSSYPHRMIRKCYILADILAYGFKPTPYAFPGEPVAD